MISVNRLFPIPEFDGNDPQAWLSQANLYFKKIPWIQDTFEKVKYVYYFMTGPAEIWFVETFTIQPKENWECFCKKILHHFTNPFGDSNLNEKFVWRKKIERDVTQGVSLDEFSMKAEKKRQRERRAEIKKVKKRREERALDKAQHEEEMAILARERAQAEFQDWEKKEEEFHFDQSKARSEIRLREGRTKPIDILTKHLDPSNDDYGIEINEPYMIFKGLTMEEMSQEIEPENSVTIESCDAYYEMVQSRKKLPQQLQETLTAAFAKILVSSFPQVRGSKVIEILADKSIGDAVKILSESNILSAPDANPETKNSKEWRERYLGIVDYPAIVLWVLQNAEIAASALSAMSAAATGMGTGAAGALVAVALGTTGPLAVAGLTTAAVGAAVPGGVAAEKGLGKDAPTAADKLGKDFYQVMLNEEPFKSTTVRSILKSYRWAPFVPVASNSTMLSVLLLLPKYRLRNVPVIGEERGLHVSIESDVKNLLHGKTYNELEVLQSDIESQMRYGTAKVVEYWEVVLKRLHIYKAKACLRDIHAKMLRKHLEHLETPLMGEKNKKEESPEIDRQDINEAEALSPVPVMDVNELMMNHFGNYLMQKLLGVCNKEQRTNILLRVTEDPGKLVRILLNTHRTWVVQKLIETLKTRQQILIVISTLKTLNVSDIVGKHIKLEPSRHIMIHREILKSVERMFVILFELVTSCYRIWDSGGAIGYLMHSVKLC